MKRWRDRQQRNRSGDEENAVDAMHTTPPPPSTIHPSAGSIISSISSASAAAVSTVRVIMANSRVVLEAAKRVSLQATKDKENAARKREEREEQLLVDGVSAFRRWVAQGRLFLDEDGHQYPTIPRKDAVAIVRVLLPCIDIKGELKMKDFSTAKACIKWLGEIGRGTTWDAEMQVLEENLEDDGLERMSI